MSHPNEQNLNSQSAASSSHDLEGDLFQELSEEVTDKFNGGSVIGGYSPNEKSKGIKSPPPQSLNAKGWRFVN